MQTGESSRTQRQDFEITCHSRELEMIGTFTQIISTYHFIILFLFSVFSLCLFFLLTIEPSKSIEREVQNNFDAK